MCLALRASGLWLRYATLQNLTPSFPWIVLPRPPHWHNPRKRRDKMFSSGNTAWQSPWLLSQQIPRQSSGLLPFPKRDAYRLGLFSCPCFHVLFSFSFQQQCGVKWVKVVVQWIQGGFWLSCFKYCTEIGLKACTWLGEISSCSCLTALPDPAWVLLSKNYKPFSSPLQYISVIWPSDIRPNRL